MVTPTSAAEPKFTLLWDGKTTSGWQASGGGNWTVEKINDNETALVGRNKAAESRHGLLLADKSYRNFTIKLQFKSVAGNSGLYFRAEPTTDDLGVKGFQAEIDPQNDVGGLYETHGRGWVIQPRAEQVAKYFKPGEWNTLEVTAKGRDVMVKINGQTSAELKNDPGRTEGKIALQLHGGQDVEVWLREIEIAELPE
ncbi:MAG: DUF1080 domain-containing protein [Pirellulales bacterium]|nr:DUF1080 domain-containing protein [Pirellulales bacterium]